MKKIAPRFSLLLLAGLLFCVLGASSAFADISYNFESGLGHNAEAIGATSGLIFSVVGGGNVQFADINSGWYSVTSDNGKTYENGEYFLSGDVAGYVSNLSDRAKVSFEFGTASWFTVGYSSEYQFVLEAYDSSDGLLISTTGAANTKSLGGTGLAYLTVSHTDISYVVLHDQGGYWLMDNITTDAPSVPEPGSCAMLLSGLAGLALRRRRRTS
ncbi:MAG: PEP-CTERM sorting domain-containing protein [Armatimonadota bacterium]|nr:PEP-CTERM sorting domain-containing protein [Armatimonadota bacterium]